MTVCCSPSNLSHNSILLCFYDLETYLVNVNQHSKKNSLLIYLHTDTLLLLYFKMGFFYSIPSLASSWICLFLLHLPRLGYRHAVNVQLCWSAGDSNSGPYTLVQKVLLPLDSLPSHSAVLNSSQTVITVIFHTTLKFRPQVSSLVFLIVLLPVVSKPWKHIPLCRVFIRWSR